VDCIITDPPYHITDPSSITFVGSKPTSVKKRWGHWEKDTFEQYEEMVCGVIDHSKRLLKENKCLLMWLRAEYGGHFARYAETIGFKLFSTLIWCLSGGTVLYVKTPTREGPMTVHDLFKLDPSTVKLWNGEKWTQVLGMSKNPTPDKLEMVLRSGERISCTNEHKWPTQRGLIEAMNLQIGDILDSCILPEPENPERGLDVGWFVGLYIAEGSMSDTTIQFAGHVKEVERYDRIKNLAEGFGGTARLYSYKGNTQIIHVDCPVLNAVLKMYVSGRIARDKRLSPKCWLRDNAFLDQVLQGYLDGDGHWDGQRWRLGFTRNYRLEESLRTLCARLGYQLRLNLAKVSYQDGKKDAFKGEIRKAISKHHNVKSDQEIVKIRNPRFKRDYYDIGVEDEPHLFSLASGVLTHNSKPNPVPHIRKTNYRSSFEYCMVVANGDKSDPFHFLSQKRMTNVFKHPIGQKETDHPTEKPESLFNWHVEVHTDPGDTILDPFMGSGTSGVSCAKLGRNFIGVELNKKYYAMADKRIAEAQSQMRMPL